MDLMIEHMFACWRHQMETSSALLAFVRWIYRSPVNSPNKGQWRGALMFLLVCAWTNGSANNRDASDLRRNRAHYDVTVMDRMFSTDSGYRREVTFWTNWHVTYGNPILCTQPSLWPQLTVLWFWHWSATLRLYTHFGMCLVQPINWCGGWFCRHG